MLMRLGLGVAMAAALAVAATGALGGPGNVATGRLTASVAGDSIVIADGDGSSRRILAPGGGSFISPDGARVAVTDYDQRLKLSRLELFSAAGGAPTRVIKVGCVRVYWAPDSTRLACVDTDFTDKPSRLLLIYAASGATTTLGKGFFDTQVSFSPDSTKLAYAQRTAASGTSGGRLRLIDLATRAITTVRNNAATAPVWGLKAIAFSTVKPLARGYPLLNVAVVQPNGSGFRQLTNVRPTFGLAGLAPVAFSADGTRLLGSLSGQDTWLAYAIDPIRGTARQVKTRVTPSTLTPDGRFVIGDSTGGEDFGPEGANVIRVPWAGGKATVLLRNADAPSYTGYAKPIKQAPVSSRCSKTTARQLVLQLGLSLNEPSSEPVARVLCGAFAGPGSNTMVVTLAGPTGPLDWLVFRWTGARWELLMRQAAGASITAAGSDIRQTVWIYRPGDSRCCPSGGTKSRIWHWNGMRFIASPWKLATKGEPKRKGFYSPSGNIACGMFDDSSFRQVVCQSRIPPQKVTMDAAGRLSVCRNRNAIENHCELGDPGEGVIPQLGYGKQIIVGRFRCLSLQIGVKCTLIRSGKGFLINRDGVSRVGP
jgi:hypothetical protein